MTSGERRSIEAVASERGNESEGQLLLLDTGQARERRSERRRRRTEVVRKLVVKLAQAAPRWPTRLVRFPRPLDARQVLGRERLAVKRDAVPDREDDEPAVKEPSAQEIGPADDRTRLAEELDGVDAVDARNEVEPAGPVAA